MSAGIGRLLVEAAATATGATAVAATAVPATAAAKTSSSKKQYLHYHQQPHKLLSAAGHTHVQACIHTHTCMHTYNAHI